MPGIPVNVSEVGRRAGIRAHQRAHQLFKQLSVDQELPPKRSHFGRQLVTIIFDARIKKFWDEGLTLKQITEALKEKTGRVSSSLNRLRKEGKIKPRAESRREFDEKIRLLRNEGKGNKAIAEILHKSISSIENSIFRSMKSEKEIKRLRKKRRTKEQVVAFRADIKGLREDENLTDRQIAQRLGVKKSEVLSHIKAMLDRGEIERKVPFRPKYRT